jgi:hypothetical protein
MHTLTRALIALAITASAYLSVGAAQQKPADPPPPPTLTESERDKLTILLTEEANLQLQAEVLQARLTARAAELKAKRDTFAAAIEAKYPGWKPVEAGEPGLMPKTGTVKVEPPK